MMMTTIIKVFIYTLDEVANILNSLASYSSS